MVNAAPFLSRNLPVESPTLAGRSNSMIYSKIEEFRG